MQRKREIAEMRKLRYEAVKLRLEIKKLKREIWWLPVVLLTGLIGALVAVATLILKVKP